jgi:putative transposase
MRFAFVQAYARIFHITTMCRVLEVSRAGYYAWRARPLCDRIKANHVLLARIRAIYAEVKGRYGSPRVHQELRALGLSCGKHRVARLMQVDGLKAKSTPPYRVTTRADADHPVVANVLDRQFAVDAIVAPNHVWAADITYIPTREGWLFLAVILDLATRRVVGWALRTRITQELTLAALQMALAHRRPGPGLLHHSDRGSQYTARAYQHTLTGAGITASMSRVGDCWDNAVVESFFATLTKELLVDGVFPSREVACRELFSYIEIWYNRRRRHSALGYRSPVEFEAELLRAS